MRKTLIYMAIAVSASFALPAILWGTLGSTERRVETLKVRQAEVAEFSAEYIKLSQGLGKLEGKKKLTNIKGIVQAVDAIFKPLGLKEKVKSVKNLSAKDPNEERAEVSIKSIDTNEAVTFLYALKHTPMPISIKKITLKSAYDEDEKLNITMVLSYVKQ